MLLSGRDMPKLLSILQVCGSSAFADTPIPGFFGNHLVTQLTDAEHPLLAPAAVTDPIGTCLHEVFPRDDGGLLGLKSVLLSKS